MIDQTKIDAAGRIETAYDTGICMRLGSTNDWILLLMQACLDLYAVQAGTKTLAQTSLGTLSARGLWVQAMQAERDRCISAIQSATTEADVLTVAPNWPVYPG